MYLIYDIKTINQVIKKSTLSFFENQKEKLKVLAQKTKENGIGYLLKRILLDEKNVHAQCRECNGKQNWEGIDPRYTKYLISK